MRPLPGNDEPPLVHTWQVGKHTVTLIANRNAGTLALTQLCDWDPPLDDPGAELPPAMEAEWQAGLSIAIAKFNTALGNAP